MTKEVVYGDNFASKDENSIQIVWERMAKEVAFRDNSACKDENSIQSV